MTATSRVMRKYEELNHDADALLGIGPGPAAAPEPPALPTRVHVETIALVDELLGRLDASATSGPSVFSPMVRALHALRGRVVKDFAKVPPDQIKAFLHELGRKMLAVGADPALPPAGD